MKKLRALIGWFVFYGGLLATGAFFVVVDPWGMAGLTKGLNRPMVGGDQRYWYAGLLRNGESDSLIIGNSTVILLDPAQISKELDAKFINVAIADGVPWENFQMLEWYLRFTTPRYIAFGVDQTWCWDFESPTEANINRFPSWLYQPLNRTKMEAFLSRSHRNYAGAILLGWFGGEPRFRADGYFDFLAEYGEYDRERSIALLWPEGVGIARPAAVVSSAETAAQSWEFSELPRIEAALASIPPETSLIFVVPPHHIATRRSEGTVAQQRFEACLKEIGRLAADRDAVLIDFHLDSDIARTDEWWWDPQHYRHNVADMLAESIARAYRERRDDPAGRYRIVWDHRHEDSSYSASSARTSSSSVALQSRPADRTGSQ